MRSDARLAVPTLRIRGREERGRAAVATSAPPPEALPSGIDEMTSVGRAGVVAAVEPTPNAVLADLVTSS